MLVAAFTFAFALVLVAVAPAVAAFVLFLGKILAVEPVCELAFSGVAHGYHLYGEVQGLACHGMVEIHADVLVADRLDSGLYHAAVLSHHREDAADLHQFLVHHAVYHEGLLGEVDHALRIVDAVAFFRTQGEADAVARFLPFHRLLELGKQHVGAVYVFEGIVPSRLIGDSAVHLQPVCEGHDLVVLYFHEYYCFTVCYPLKSTSLNAIVGMSFDLHCLESSPAASRLFQRVMKLPVTSISLTGLRIFPSSNQKPSMP